MEFEEFTEMIENMKHSIGFDNRKVRGTKHRRFESYRNYFTTNGNNKTLDKAVSVGLMTKRKLDEKMYGKDFICYFVSDKGFKYLSNITGVTITKESK